MPASPTRCGLVGAVVALAGLALAGPAAAQEAEFQKTQLVDTTLNPMEIEVAPDGRVFYTERRGVVGVWDPETESSREIGTVPVTTFQENGLMGIALAPDFDESGWIYLSYSALPLESLTQRVSRFQLDGNGDLDMDSEQPVFEWTHLRETCCHSAGALEFDPDGNLLISTGDNTNPFESQGYTPIDERAGRQSYDAQRTSANTNDHNGKLLRITPNELIPPGTEPGIGQTYAIPGGNMFAPGTEDTLPEIYAMGFRNPFRFKVDEQTGWSLLADYGPDAGVANPERGPQGSVEYDVITEPAYFGWPYCVREDTPYIDGEFTDPNNTFVSTGVPFDCDAPVNTSPNNTGLTELPPVQPATMWMGYTETDPRVPGLGTGGAPMAGPRYYFDPDNPSETKFPEEFDGKWFIAEWNNDWIKTAELDAEGNASNIEDFPSLGGPEGPGYLSPMDMEFGPDGSLYLAEWGQGFAADHPESGIYRIDHVELTGPQVTASADPERGTVPLDVQFDGEATNPDGTPNPNFTYEWDFGDGTPTSNQQDPTHTYTEVGTYTATLTVTDPDTDEQGTASVEIRVDPVETCPTGPLSDEFDGTEIDPKWEIIRPDGTRPPTVSDGELHFPIDNGSIYGAGTSARNIMVQPLPSGDVAVTAKIRVDGLTENYHQAGLRVYSDDDNWASVHMIHAGGARDFEFIWEANGNPRNEAADKLGGIPANAPLEYYVRLVSDGEELNAFYSYDGEEFLPVGRPGSLATFDNPRIGPVALSDAASTHPVAHFDWVRFDPDTATGGGDVNDEFDGTSLDLQRWNAIVNHNPDTVDVAGGELTVTTEPGDIYTGDTTPPPNNFILQSADHAGADWTIETKMSATIDGGYSQGGLMAMADTDNYVKFDPISDVGNTRINRIELRSEVGTAIQDPQPNVDVPIGTTDIWLRLTKEGTTYSGEYSFDGETWESMPNAVENPMESADFGLFAIGVQQGGDTVSFDYFRADGGGGGGGSDVDEFDGTELDTARWNDIVRHDPALYDVSGGVLSVETVGGDIYQNGDPAPTRNFFLQSADHAGQDWTIETKVLGGELGGGYAQGGLMAYEDDDNYIKFDLISDEGQPAVNRIELRSEVNGQIQEPQPQVTPLPAGTEDAWLRLTKEGETYSGEYSLDGETWTSVGAPVGPNAMVAPRFGIFTLGVNLPGPVVGFEYFSVDSGTGCPEPGECTRSDEFDGDELELDRWTFRHPTTPASGDGAPSVADGSLVLPLGASEIDTGSTGPIGFIGQPLPEGGDWEVTTEVDAAIAGDDGAPVPWAQVGVMIYQDDAHFLKLAHTRVGNAGGGQQQTFVEVVHETADSRTFAGNSGNGDRPQTLWMRLLSEDGMVTAYFSEEDPELGGTWTEVTDAPLDLDSILVGSGPIHIGPYGGNGTVDARFDYFRVTPDDDLCPGGDPPEIDSVTADPTAGFAPLEVDFGVEASDPDGDQLSYSWDFGDGNTSDQQNPTHTYTEAGEFDAEVTVSDGTNETSDSVTVTVLAEDDPEASFRTLVFSKTAGFRHSSIDEGHTALDTLAEENGFQIDHTEDASLFRPDILSHFDTVMFLSTTGDALTDGQQAAFESYIQGGGGYAGIHSASDTEYGWNWYGHLVGAYFRNHPGAQFPQFQEATVRVEDDEHPSTASLPDTYQRTDEWYNLKSPDFAEVGDDAYSPRPNVHVLANIDESTYEEEDGNTTDDDHPMTWCQRYDGGLSWYTIMGHTEASYTEPNFLTQVLGGLETTAGVEQSATCGFAGEAALRLRVDPERRLGKVGKEARFTATTRNTGESPASELEVCVKAPDKVRVVGEECETADSLAAGDDMTSRFTLKPKRSARGDKVKITFTAKAAGIDKAKDTAILKVRR